MSGILAAGCSALGELNTPGSDGGRMEGNGATGNRGITGECLWMNMMLVDLRRAMSWPTAWRILRGRSDAE